MDENLKNKILLTKDGKAIFHDLDEESKEWESREITESHILFHLQEPIVLEEGFTLRSYFHLIENYPLFKLIDYFLGCYLEEFQECPENGCTDPDNEIDYLCLNRVMVYEAPTSIEPSRIFSFEEDLVDEDGNIHIEDSIEYDIHFDGVSEDGLNHYAIEFTSLNKLLDHKIVIGNAKISIELPGRIEDYDNLEDKFITRETEDNNFTLYEFVKEIIWELSFCGCPEERDDKWEMIEKRAEEANLKKPEKNNDPEMD